MILHCLLLIIIIPIVDFLRDAAPQQATAAPLFALRKTPTPNTVVAVVVLPVYGC
jgi:hypothetical protein